MGADQRPGPRFRALQGTPPPRHHMPAAATDARLAGRRADVGALLVAASEATEKSWPPVTAGAAVTPSEAAAVVDGTT